MELILTVKMLNSTIFKTYGKGTISVSKNNLAGKKSEKIGQKKLYPCVSQFNIMLVSRFFTIFNNTLHLNSYCFK